MSSAILLNKPGFTLFRVTFAIPESQIFRATFASQLKFLGDIWESFDKIFANCLRSNRDALAMSAYCVDFLLSRTSQLRFKIYWICAICHLKIASIMRPRNFAWGNLSNLSPFCYNPAQKLFKSAQTIVSSTRKLHKIPKTAFFRYKLEYMQWLAVKLRFLQSFHFFI